MTESEQGPPGGDETLEEKREPGGSAGVPREEVMRRLAEILRAGPPDLSGSAGPAAAGGLPLLPSTAGEFDQESAAALLAALGEFFNQRKDTGEEAGAGEPERE